MKTSKGAYRRRAKKSSVPLHIRTLYQAERLRRKSIQKKLFPNKAAVDEINALRLVFGYGPVSYESCGIFHLEEQLEKTKSLRGEQHARRRSR